MVATTVTVAFAAETSSPAKEGETYYTDQGDEYVYTEGTAAFAKASEENLEKEVLKIGLKFTGAVIDEKTGAKVPLTALNAGALNGSEATTIKVGPQTRNIKAKAFKGVNNLKKLYIRATKKVTLNKNAFKGSKTNLKKLKVFVNKGMSKKNFRALKKVLVKMGIQAKNIKQI